MPLSSQAQYDDADAYGYPDTLIAVTNAVKFDPIQIIQGDFRIFYERMIGKRWSAEASFGPTRRNYTASIFQYELDDFGANVNIRTRYAAGLAVRRYFWETDELYGLYVSGAVVHRVHEKSHSIIGIDGTLTGHAFEDRRRYTDLMCLVGYQALTLQSNIFFDFYVGAGARYRDFDVLRSSDLNDPNAYAVTSEQSWIGTFTAGVKLGIGF